LQISIKLLLEQRAIEISRFRINVIKDNGKRLEDLENRNRTNFVASGSNGKIFLAPGEEKTSSNLDYEM
jgi:hypothetical protein